MKKNVKLIPQMVQFQEEKGPKKEEQVGGPGIQKRKVIVLTAMPVGTLGSSPVLQTDIDILATGGGLYSLMQLFGSLWLALTQGQRAAL